MVNNKKGKILKSVWFDSDKQYRQLINALEGNFQDEVLSIMFEIYKKGGLE